MREIVAIWYRGANYQIGRGRDFYGIWPVEKPAVQPLEWWPLTGEGWSGAWSRFTDIETPGTIVPGTRTTPATAAQHPAGPSRTRLVRQHPAGPAAQPPAAPVTPPAAMPVARPAPGPVIPLIAGVATPPAPGLATPQAAMPATSRAAMPVIRPAPEPDTPAAPGWQAGNCERSSRRYCSRSESAAG